MSNLQVYLHTAEGQHSRARVAGNSQVLRTAKKKKKGARGQQASYLYWGVASEYRKGESLGVSGRAKHFARGGC